MDGEHASAEVEARERGMAFLVDGMHVSADRVMILSLPDTVGPISAMRREKAEAVEVLKQVQTTLKVHADSQTVATLANALQLLRQVCDGEPNATSRARRFLARIDYEWREKNQDKTSPLAGSPDNSRCQAACGGARCVSWCGVHECLGDGQAQDVSGS